MTRDSDYERRNEALHKAILARKEADTAEDIVKRAEIFLQFLDPSYGARKEQAESARPARPPVAMYSAHRGGPYDLEF